MSEDPTDKKPLVAVAGASGFVGTHLRMALSDLFDFRALTRSPNIVEQNKSRSSTHWQHCDLYSLPRLSEALIGCDYAIYLVHSMAPSSRLMQGNFEDTDLLLADNFIRAAEAAGVKHVVYLSGLMPEDVTELSPHLRSRLEVEAVLSSRAISVTTLRAGLIFGPGGSSFSMLVNLVGNLPAMILPGWVQSTTQSIDVENVCQAFRLALTDPSLEGGTYDLGGHTPMSYGDLIAKTSELLGRKFRSISVPYNCFTISKYWVAWFGKVPVALVGPLQESLQHDLSAKPNRLLDQLQDRLVPLEESMRRGVDAKGKPKPNPRSQTQSVDRKLIREARRVRSVQRMPLPKGWDSDQVSEEYGNWLTKSFRGLINAEKDVEGVVRFKAMGQLLTLLELTPTPYSLKNQRRRAYYVSGGVLSKKVDPPGRFEFRLFPETNCLIASIHEFSPTLPWWIYANTQAWAHLKVMHAFGRHLGRIDRETADPSQSAKIRKNL